MKIDKVSILAILASLLFTGAALAQDSSKEIAADSQQPQQETASMQTPVTQTPVMAQPQTEPETLWIWGEVVTVDPAVKTITIKYLDYETDQEKNMVIGIDEKTTYENIKSIDEIKPKDTLSIDYIAGTDSKNTAKNISLEKPESAPASAENPAEETSQENTQPPLPESQTQPAGGQQ